jgi:transposase-like protein
MKDGIIGATMVAHKILPGAKTILRIKIGLPKEAKMRSDWIRWYFAHGNNKRLTARHFGISPTTLYKWLSRYQNRNLLSLSNQSRKPRRFRTSNLSQDTINLVKKLRQENMALSKYKLEKILTRDHSLKISASTINRFRFN